MPMPPPSYGSTPLGHVVEGGVLEGDPWAGTGDYVPHNSSRARSEWGLALAIFALLLALYKFT